MPYTYLLKHVPSGQVYYGVRLVHKDPPEEDLWKNYFSSSNTVRNLIAIEGKDSFLYEVRRVFSSRTAAASWEKQVLKRMNVKNDQRWLNLNDMPAPPILYGEQNGFYGLVHTQETRDAISEKAKKRWAKNRKKYLEIVKKKPTLTDEVRNKKRTTGRENIIKLFPEGWGGKNNPMYGKRHATISRTRMRQAKIGMYDGEKNPMHGKNHSDTAKEAISKARKGCVWIAQGNCSKQVKRAELEDWVMAGWTRGRTTKK